MDFPKEQLESLWAPWRVEYFNRERSTGEDFLAEAASTSDDAAHLVVTRRQNAFLILNKYPYASGHLMVVPYRRTAQMEDLADAEVLDLWRLSIHAQRLLREVTKAEGFNIGFNLGSAGGAGFKEHLHLHIVPRWTGDQNFMPILAGTRVIPEGLQPLYQRLVAADRNQQG
ncbi:MAG: HIT domain-containing protein [Verrucomicrobia bacterium]|nr:MAG: HIT domain-containing protein [Verrucomicrobiota bacterium]